MISYSQHGEDIRLSWLFPDETDGFYIDIGANDPTFLSVTKHFYDRGWRGINVEPTPSLCAQLNAARPRDVNLNIGISHKEGALTFYESPSISGWSTFSPGMAAHYRARGLFLAERTIPVVSLTDLFTRHVDRPVDFLKIDVEGNEGDVIRGIDWNICRPRVMVIENAWPEDWAYLIPESDYLMFKQESANRFYVRRDEPALMAAALHDAPPPGPCTCATSTTGGSSGCWPHWPRATTSGRSAGPCVEARFNRSRPPAGGIKVGSVGPAEVGFARLGKRLAKSDVENLR
jgi:FkbM family methyltransferase